MSKEKEMASTPIGEDDFDESSIEALSWSDIEGEQLQKDVQGELAAAAMDVSETSSDLNTLLLSSSLLQSMDSLEEVENWANKAAKEPPPTPEEHEEGKNEGGREGKVGTWECPCCSFRNYIKEKVCICCSTAQPKRKKKIGKGKMDAMMTSMASSSPGLSEGDPLSNAPVLDDGPIWNAGPKLYTFQENRRFNQKLTFGMLFALVLAIGLGLGNLVAYNECEAEYKGQKPQPATAPPRSPPSSPPPTAPEMKKTEERKKQDIEMDKEQYMIQMQTLSKIVNTLDNLQRKIDKFENTTRHLGGVVMMKEEREDKESPSAILEEIVHPDQEDTTESGATRVSGEAPTTTTNSIEPDEEEYLLELLEEIEETDVYLLRLREEYNPEYEDLRRVDYLQKVFPEINFMDVETLPASLAVIKTSTEAFVTKERDELRVKKILGLAEERLPEQYSKQELIALKERYDSFMASYPFAASIAVEKERMKFPSSDQDKALRDEIHSFFVDKHEGKKEEDKYLDDYDFASFQQQHIPKTPTPEPEPKKTKGKKKGKKEKGEKKKKKEKKRNSYKEKNVGGKDVDVLGWLSEDDDDDWESKKRRYSSPTHQHPHQHQVEQETNWLLERTKAREQLRTESHHQHPPEAKGKRENWQMERERMREKLRDGRVRRR